MLTVHLSVLIFLPISVNCVFAIIKECVEQTVAGQKVCVGTCSRNNMCCTYSDQRSTGAACQCRTKEALSSFPTAACLSPADVGCWWYYDSEIQQRDSNPASSTDRLICLGGCINSATGALDTCCEQVKRGQDWYCKCSDTLEFTDACWPKMPSGSKMKIYNKPASKSKAPKTSGAKSSKGLNAGYKN